jgi:hypothetical protein
MRAALGLILFYLASAHVVLTLGLGTCTQGDAGGPFGGVISLALYLLGCIGLLITSRPGWAAALLLPLVPVLAWELIFSLHLIASLLTGPGSACALLTGGVPHPPDGNEPVYAFIWLALTLTAWSGAGAAVVRAFHGRE